MSLFPIGYLLHVVQTSKTVVKATACTLCDFEIDYKNRVIVMETTKETVKVVLWSNFYSLIFWEYHIHVECHERIKMEISALVLGIFKFEKWVTYANEMTDDVIHSTKYYRVYRAISANLQCRTLKLGRLIHVVLKETPVAITISVAMATHSFPVPTHLI